MYINTGSTFGNMCSVAAASLILPFLPMLPIQILLTNFLTDFPFLTITTDNVDKEQLEKLGKWNLKLIRNYMVIFGIHSSLFDLITFLTLFFLLKAKALCKTHIILINTNLRTKQISFFRIWGIILLNLHLLVLASGNSNLSLLETWKTNSTFQNLLLGYLKKSRSCFLYITI